MIRTISFIVFSTVIVTLLLNLGRWQLDRAAEKKLLQQQITTRQQHSIIDLSKLPAQPLWHSITLEGEFDYKRPILLDNQLYRGRPGYHLYLPFISQQQWLLVNLGWIAAPPYRDVFPQLPVVEGKQKISGIIAPANPLLQFKADLFTEQWPLRVQNIELEWLSEQLQRSLPTWVVQISVTDPLALTQTWQPIVMESKKHYGYALQWFLLAFAVVIISWWWLRRGMKK